MNKDEYLDKLFISWIMQYPDSYHPCDMERFYKLVKYYCNKRGKKSLNWLSEKINNFDKKSLDPKVVREYEVLFGRLMDFYCYLKHGVSYVDNENNNALLKKAKREYFREKSISSEIYMERLKDLKPPVC